MAITEEEFVRKLTVCKMEIVSPRKTREKFFEYLDPEKRKFMERMVRELNQDVFLSEHSLLDIYDLRHSSRQLNQIEDIKLSL